MDLGFLVGDHEQHAVYFSWNQMWGGLKISVDGVNVVNTVQMFSVSLVTSYEFTVGDEEKHVVRIEKRRKLFAGGFRPQTLVALVDGSVVSKARANMTWGQVVAVLGVIGIVFVATIVILFVTS